MKNIIKKENLKFSSVLDWLICLAIFGCITLVCNSVGYGAPIIESIPGMIILLVITFVGLLCAKIIPINLPAIIYISVISLLIALPISPIGTYVGEMTAKVNTLAICTAILSYSGVAIGKQWAAFRKMGWKSIVVTIVVIFSTFVGSAIVAQFVITLQGVV